MSLEELKIQIKKSRAEAPQCFLKNETYVGLLCLRHYIPKNLSAISVERLWTRLTLAPV